MRAALLLVVYALLTGPASAETLRYQSGRMDGYTIAPEFRGIPLGVTISDRGGRFWNRTRGNAAGAAADRNFGGLDALWSSYFFAADIVKQGIERCDSQIYADAMSSLQQIRSQLEAEHQQAIDDLAFIRREIDEHEYEIDQLVELPLIEFQSAAANKGGTIGAGRLLGWLADGSRCVPVVGAISATTSALAGVGTAIRESNRMRDLIGNALAKREIALWYEHAVLPRYESDLRVMGFIFDGYRNEFASRMQVGCNRPGCEPHAE